MQDQLTTDLLGAGLTYMQLTTIADKLTAARSMTMTLREQSDYQSDLWDDMTALFREIGDGIDSLLAAMKARTEADYGEAADLDDTGDDITGALVPVCGICGTTDPVLDLVTNSRAAGWRECRDLHACGDRVIAAAKATFVEVAK